MKKSIDNIVNHAEVSEKEIEKYLTKRVKELGGLCLKYSNPSVTGYPDRLVILRCYKITGCAFFVELKSKGKKPTKLQTIRINEIMDLGISCYVCDSKAKVDEVLDYYIDFLGL